MPKHLLILRSRECFKWVLGKNVRRAGPSRAAGSGGCRHEFARGLLMEILKSLMLQSRLEAQTRTAEVDSRRVSLQGHSAWCPRSGEWTRLLLSGVDSRQSKIERDGLYSRMASEGWSVFEQQESHWRPPSLLGAGATSTGGRPRVPTGRPWITCSRTVDRLPGMSGFDAFGRSRLVTSIQSAVADAGLDLGPLCAGRPCTPSR